MSAPTVRRAPEKRREPRRRASGKVVVLCAAPRTKRIEGRLIDVSPSGFRMAHTDALLQSGETVEFAHEEAAGKARVMWNRIMERSVETGFLLIERA